MSVIISSDLAIVSLSQPLSHSRIGYDSILTRDASTVTVSSEDLPTYPKENLSDGLTFDFWKPTSLPATVMVDAGSAVPVNYLGMAAHELGDNANGLSVEHSADGSTWTEAESVTVGDNTPLMLLFNRVEARYWRVTISGSGLPRVGILYLGEVLEMQRPVYGGVEPPTMARKSRIVPNRANGGQYLGRSLIREGIATSVSYRHLRAAWIRSVFDPFIEAARTEPFFFAWRPDEFPEEVVFAWNSGGDIVPSNMGKKDWMELSMDIEGIKV